jgi:hypothetical protein
MGIYVKVGEGERIPKGYGLAYWDFVTLRGVFYPIPLNILIRFIVGVYHRLIDGLFPLTVEMWIIEAQRAAYYNGFKDGERSTIKGIAKEVNRLIERTSGSNN